MSHIVPPLAKPTLEMFLRHNRMGVKNVELKAEGEYIASAYLPDVGNLTLNILKGEESFEIPGCDYFGRQVVDVFHYRLVGELYMIPLSLHTVLSINTVYTKDGKVCDEGSNFRFIRKDTAKEITFLEDF